jgi:hypothetical protein
MPLDGWIKLYRLIIDKPIWKQSTPEQKSILITLLCMVNHEAEEWEWQGKKYVCRPGQKITSLEKIRKACGKGVSIQNIRTAFVRFEKLEFLTYESTKESRLVTVLNWELYQSEEKNQQSNQQTGNKDLTTNKNDKNNKNKTYSAFFEKVWSLYPNKKGKAQVSDTTKEKLYEIGFEQLIKCIDRYKTSKPDWQQYQNGSTFFYSGYVDYLDKNYQEQEETSTYRNMTNYEPGE